METYYNKKDLAAFGKGIIGEDAPELWTKFLDYYGSAFADGALTAREKALIGLAVAQALKCPYCIDHFTQTCVQNGCDQDQIMESIHCAASLAAGVVLVHGVQSKEVSDKLSF